MWIPQNEKELLNALSNASLEESETFDAKKEIPPKSPETAKDVAALANTAGGVLIYGIEEDAGGRPTIASPITLSGQKERIDQIIQTCVSEVPVFNIKTIQTAHDPAKGYLILIVPPSERAPHMVIVKGDKRYYGRSETVNYILDESQVARLYERRRAVSESILPLLEKAVKESPISDLQGFVHLHIVAQPILRDDQILTNAHRNAIGEFGFEIPLVELLNGWVKNANSEDVFPKDGYYEGFHTPSRWLRRPEGYLGKLASAHSGDDSPSANTLQLQINLDGGARLFCGWVGRTSDEHYEKGVKRFHAEFAASNTTRFLFFLSKLYRQAGYFGKVNFAVAVTNLKDAVDGQIQSMDLRYAYHFENDDYQETTKAMVDLLADNPKQCAAELLMPLIDSISQNRRNPFAQK